MRCRSLLIATALACASGSFAQAEFLGAYVEQRDDLGTPAGFVTYRLYALFSSKDDVLLAVGGLPGLAELRMTTTDPAGFASGAAPRVAGLIAEDFPLPPELAAAWDSYITIGEGVPPCCPTHDLGDGIHAAIVGTSVIEPDGAWYDPDPGTPPEGIMTRLGWSVLVSQLTVRAGHCVELSGLAFWQAGAPAGFMASQLHAVVPRCVPPCVADLDGTGDVGLSDLLAVLSAWGVCDACPADLDLSGSVGLLDLLRVLATWGPCP